MAHRQSTTSTAPVTAAREWEVALEVASSWRGEPAAPEERVWVTLRAAREGLLIDVRAPYHGDPAPAGPAGPKDALWEHEVVELFLVGTGSSCDRVPYTEVELSPHGHYLVLLLEGMRRPVARQLPIPYRAAIEGRVWRAEARLPWALVPPPPHRVNVFAMYGAGSARRYLAHAPVPGPEPDFHRLDAFPRLSLPWPSLPWIHPPTTRNPTP